MPKPNKTHKATAKRFSIKRSKNGGPAKITMRTCGQGHFNARQDGNTKRNKRSDHTIASSQKTILRALPHS